MMKLLGSPVVILVVSQPASSGHCPRTASGLGNTRNESFWLILNQSDLLPHFAPRSTSRGPYSVSGFVMHYADSRGGHHSRSE
ncbi:hypothetical protein B0J15DRAFT_501719 [Fusarium solani]|uniref:Secreted protein n=1 Tax=Fusarium solani TaxID=169388 RepID=A0A9P9GQT4_FUSSL|nr:uncharacterized protein B0J15DRAFT_501719 [Fusarium solani]KAH7242990.1 hypothetical protein B0J15DRAFT_501719 [Fusarium solani]